MRFSPGDLSIELPTLPDGDISQAVTAAQAAFVGWRKTPIEARIACLKNAQQRLAAEKSDLARGIALETGKPITEARGELDAVVAKIDLAIDDANKHLADQTETDSLHPNLIRRRPRGVAGVIGPFNFPIHLAHGAITAYLLAGNTVVFKPSPHAMNVCETYGELMRDSFPQGVFEIVQGAATQGQQLVADPRVRSVCFTGSVTAGQAIARATADDLSKDVALELGGKNAVIVCADANLDQAANAIADAICLTAGQRCNSTSRVLVDQSVEADLIARLRDKLLSYVPGDPLLDTTRLGPLISQQAQQRYLQAISSDVQWLVEGAKVDSVDNRRGHFVLPALCRLDADDAPQHALFTQEIFAPIAAMVAYRSEDHAIELANATDFGLTTSVFTANRARFMRLADALIVGNAYQNLPTTFSPGTLPFGGLKSSGNHHPGGRSFVRFATDEQVVQMGSVVRGS